MGSQGPRCQCRSAHDRRAARLASSSPACRATGTRLAAGTVGGIGLTQIRRSAIALLALTLAAGCGGGVASPTPAATAAREALDAGEYRSSAFSPPLTVTLPDGWLVAGDSPDYFALQPVASDAVGVYVFRSPRAASQELDCPIAPAPAVGSTAAELVDWIRDRPGLVVGAAVPVSIGGLAGLQVDVRIADGWTASCPFAEGLPTVPLFVGAADSGFRWVVAGSERLRLSVLDVPGKGTVVVDIDAFDGAEMDRLLADATPIVESLTFGLP